MTGFLHGSLPPKKIPMRQDVYLCLESLCIHYMQRRRAGKAKCPVLSECSVLSILSLQNEGCPVVWSSTALLFQHFQLGQL